MAKLTIILDKRKANQSGLFPIKFQLTHNRKNTTISTGVFASEKHFVGDPLRVVSTSFPNAHAINARLKEVYYAYDDMLQRTERTRDTSHLTAADLRQILQDKPKEEPAEVVTFSSEMLAYINTCRAEKTAEGYKYAHTFLQRYFKTEDVPFESLTYTNIVAFDRWLEQEGLSMNSRSIVLRNIRAVFNSAIKADKVSPALYPFRKFEIKSARKEKKNLSRETMQRLIQISLRGEEKRARDFFLLSFYLCGINPVDLYNLKRPTKSGEVAFVRQKIAHTEPLPVHIFLPKQALDLCKEYASEKYLINFHDKHRDYDTFKRRMSERLASVGRKVGCDNLYFYMARYTWATFADHIGVPHEVISKSLGHSDKSTAEKYYIDYDWERTRQANERVIDYLFAAI